MPYADESEMELHRESIVDAVFAAVTAKSTHSKASRIVGVVGPWGSGKSWVVRELLKQLNAKPSAEVIEFNPWLFGSERALGEGFATALLSRVGGKLQRRRRAAKVVEDFGPLLTPLVSRVGFDAGTASSQIAIHLSDVGSPAKLQKLVSAATEHRQFIIVMDDLDRLAPDELLTVFKLIRLVGDLPTVTYLLAYDQQTLLHLIAATPIGGGSTDRSRSYLEKVVELTFSIPPLSTRNVEDLVLRPLVAFGSSLDPSWPEVDQESLLYRLRPLITSDITTPRAAHRYLDSVSELSKPFAREINYIDWCISSFLIVFYPDVWELVRRDRYTLTGQVMDPFLGEEARRASAKLLDSSFEKALGQRANGQQIHSALRGLFPGWSHSLEDRNSGSANLAKEGKARSIAHPDFVDKYVWRAQPAGTVSEAEVQEALREITQTGDSNWLSESLRAQPSETLDALDRQIDDPGNDLVRSLIFLEGVYTALVNRSTSSDPFGIGARLRAMYAVTLTSMSSAQLEELWHDSPVGLTDRGLLRGALVGPNLRSLPPGEHTADWVRASNQRLADSLESYLLVNNVGWDQHAANEALVDLMRLDVARARSIIISQLKLGRWEPLDIAVIWVFNSNRGDGVALGGFASDRFTRDVGYEIAERVYSRVQTEHRGDPLPPIVQQPLAPSRSNAELVAVRGLLSFEMKQLIDRGNDETPPSA